MPTAISDDTNTAPESASTVSNVPKSPKPAKLAACLDDSGASPPEINHELPNDGSWNIPSDPNDPPVAAAASSLPVQPNNDPAINFLVPALPPLDIGTSTSPADDDDCVSLIRNLSESISSTDEDEESNVEGDEQPSNDEAGENEATALKPVRSVFAIHWRVRARNVTDWNNPKAIKKQFPPYTRKKYGQLQPPMFMINSYSSIYEKAKAMSYWRGLTTNQQATLKSHYKKLEAAEKAAMKEREKFENRVLKDRRRRLKREAKAAMKAAEKEAKAAKKAAEKPAKDMAKAVKRKALNDKSNAKRKKAREEVKMVSLVS
jgi:hypothetical protein